MVFNDVSLLGLKPHEINQAGVSRVFQTPEIFQDLTLLENVMIPAFARRDGAFTINACGRTEDATANIVKQAEALLEDVGSRGQEGSDRGFSVPRRQAAAGAGHVPGSEARNCCCWTSRPPA